VSTAIASSRGVASATWYQPRASAPAAPPLRLLFPHGFGDVIQALPSFRRLALKTGRRLSLGLLRRLPACHEVVQNQPWCGGTFRIADPWNDFPPVDTWEGYRRGWDALARGYPDALPVLTKGPTSLLCRTVSKAVRIAAELGVPFESANPIPNPDVLGTGFEVTKAMLYLGGVRREAGSAKAVAVLHGTAGNRSKDVRPARLEEIATETLLRAGHPKRGGIAFVHLPVAKLGGGTMPETVRFHHAVISKADLFVGVDSGPAHLASTTATRCVWVFTGTPVEQAIPLYARPNLSALVLGPVREHLLARWGAWASANPDLVPGGLEVHDGGRL
jgi:hypothetical protein